MDYWQHKLPCDATQISRFRRVLSEAGAEQLLKTTIETAVAIKAAKPAEFEREILDSLLREVRHKMHGLADHARQELNVWLERAERIHTHCHRQGLMVSAASFTGNPYDGHTLATQLELTSTLLQDIGTKPTTAVRPQP